MKELDKEINVTLSKEGITYFLADLLTELAIDELQPHVTILDKGQIHFVLGDLTLLIDVTDLDEHLN